MRIYDPKEKTELGRVTLYLTPEEAAELADTVRALANDPHQHHGHVSSGDSTREITVAVYTSANLANFDAESRHLLQEKE